MIRRRSSWLVGVLVCGALAAGCGSSGNSTTSSHSSSPATTSTKAPATTAAKPASPSAASPLGGLSATQVVAMCRRVIQAQKTLSASAKARLKGSSRIVGICYKAVTGDTTAVKQFAQALCEETIRHSRITGAAREHALSACKSR